MAINRYNLPAEQPIANTYVPIPFQEMLAAAEAQQKAYDDLEAKRQALADTDFYALDPDLDYVTGKQNELQSDVQTVYDAYSSGDLRKARRTYNDINRKWEKELNPLTGLTGGAMERHDKRAEFYKALKESDANPTQIQYAMDYFDANYAKQGGIGLDPRNMGAYSTEELAKWINPVEWADKYGAGFLSDIDAWVDVDPNGGYVIKRSGSDEHVDEEEIDAVLMNYANSDPELMAWLEQGERMGYSSKDMILDAIAGATQKYGFSKKKRDESWQKDWLYERALDKQDEAAAAQPVVSTSKENIQDNPLTNALNDIQAGTLWGDEQVNPIEAFSKVTGDYQRQIDFAEQRIQEIDFMLRDREKNPLSNEAVKSLKGERDQLVGRVQSATIERDWYNQMESDVLSQVLDPIVADNPNFEGMSYKEIYTELKTNKDLLKTNIDKRDKLVSEESAQILKIINSEAFKGQAGKAVIYKINSEGLIEGTLGGYPIQNSKLPQNVLEFNAKVKEANDNISYAATYMGDALELEMPASGMTLEDAQGVLGYLSNEKGTGVLDKVGNKAKNYADNITTTNLVHSFTPDQVAKNPALNAVQSSLDSGVGTFGDFRPIDPNTNKPGKTQKISASDNINYTVTGVEFTKDGPMVSVVKRIENQGDLWFPDVIEKGYIKLDPGTNIPNLISQQYLQKVKQAKSVGQVDSESERAVFASAPIFSNTYKIVNEFQEKTPDLYEVDKQGDLSIYKIPNVPYYDESGNIQAGELMISVDKESQSGEIYNFYGLNVSEGDIKNGKADFIQVTGNQLEYVVAGTLLQNL